MFSVGETLRSARLEQGLDLETVSARTKISRRHLEAIEADDRSSIPGGFFYKSFAQQYARFLSLDTKDIDAEIDRVLSALAPLPLPGQGDPNWRRVRPVTISSGPDRTKTYRSLAVLALVLGCCSGFYALYKYSTRPVAAVARNELRTPDARPQTVVKTDAIPVSLASPQQPKEPQQPVAIAAPAATESVPGRRVLLDLTAHEKTWLSVSSDGKPVFSGILAPNESKIVEGKESAKIRVGNAAGIEVRLNGRPVGPLGHRGQVLIVVFTPDNFQVISPAKESD